MQQEYSHDAGPCSEGYALCLSRLSDKFNSGEVGSRLGKIPHLNVKH